MMKLDSSEVLSIYLGAGPTGGYLPGNGEERLRAVFPTCFPEALATIAKYLEGGPEHPIDEWTSNDLGKEHKIYEQKLARAYSELSARAVSALACCWSFNWR